MRLLGEVHEIGGAIAPFRIADNGRAVACDARPVAEGQSEVTGTGCLRIIFVGEREPLVEATGAALKCGTVWQA